jgi:CBS domain-containing protein
MITVDEFMTSELCTLRETDSINDARKIMTVKHIRHVPITDGDNHMLGLVTQRDVLAASGSVLEKGHENPSAYDESDIKLSDIMIRDVKVISKSDSLRQAALYMQSHKYGCLPVVSGGRLVGIVTDSDFVTIAINLLEQAELSEEMVEAEDRLDDIDIPEADEIL